MKIVFITYHNWQTKRHGGFHQFAKYASQSGHEVVFFSFARPYYIVFKNDERLNRKVLQDLSRGIVYDNEGYHITNVTWPTLGLPGFLRKFLPYEVNKWLMTHSITPFHRFSKKWFQDTDCFVFESADAVLLAKKIRSDFPNAILVYRPSDPLWERSNDFFHIKGEREMIEIADKIILVNEQAKVGYEQIFPDVFDLSKVYTISNGVDLKAFSQKYPVPELLKHPKTACYVGAFEPDYELMINTANALKSIRFILITPHTIGNELKAKIDRIDNLYFIPGIPPSEVPSWITNCSVVLQPFPKSLNYANKTSVNLTAQNYKAMAAGKPIVAHQVPSYLSKYGLKVALNEDEFIRMVEDSINERNPQYDVDLRALDWDNLCENFLNAISK